MKKIYARNRNIYARNRNSQNKAEIENEKNREIINKILILFHKKFEIKTRTENCLFDNHIYIIYRDIHYHIR